MVGFGGLDVVDATTRNQFYSRHQESTDSMTKLFGNNFQGKTMLREFCYYFFIVTPGLTDSCRCYNKIFDCVFA